MGQDKLIPPLAPEAAGIITGSEQILKEYASASSLTATDIKRLIEDVLHNPDLNAEDVDTDMLQRTIQVPCREGIVRTDICHTVGWMSVLWLQGKPGSSWK